MNSLLVQRTPDGDILKQYGGKATPDELHSRLPDFPQVEGCYILLQDYFDYIAEKENSRFSVGIYFVNSVSMGCRIHPRASGRAVIVMPIGVVARLRSLTRLLLQYCNQKYQFMSANSPLDTIPDDEWFIPRFSALYLEIIRIKKANYSGMI